MGAKKIALMGNMNNMMFSLVRYLRDAGEDAHLLLYVNEMDHFHPSTDSFDLSYRDYCHTLTWGDALKVRTTPAEKIAADLEPYDILIGCGAAPAYCYKVGRQLDIFKPYGSDIADLTQYRPSVFYPQYSIEQGYGVHMQRQGLSQCTVLHAGIANPRYERCYSKFLPRAQRWCMGMPLFYAPPYKHRSMMADWRQTYWAEIFQAVRNKNDFVVFYHNRHSWRTSAEDPNNKGTDVFLRGFADFSHSAQGARVTLVTIEYGPDVSASKVLLDELGIADKVLWLPRMGRKDVMAGLHYSDVGCGVFSRSTLTNSVIQEVLAAGRPLIGWRDDARYVAQHEDLYPMLHASNVNEVACQLREMAADSSKRIKIGDAARTWLDGSVVAPAVAQYQKFISEHRK
jgi:hypothetical protein